MDSKDPGNRASASNSMPISDTDIVQKLMEDMKSQGVLDEVRNMCASEVDTKVI